MRLRAAPKKRLGCGRPALQRNVACPKGFIENETAPRPEDWPRPHQDKLGRYHISLREIAEAAGYRLERTGPGGRSRRRMTRKQVDRDEARWWREAVR